MYQYKGVGEPDVDVDCRGRIDCTDLETLLNDLSKKTSNTDDIQQTEFELFRKTIDALDKKINTNLDELSKNTVQQIVIMITLLRLSVVQ